MIPCSSSRHTRPTPAACLVEVSGERRPVCGACARALADNGVQGIVHPLPDPQEPTMATAPTPHDDRPARSTPNRHLPLILRPDADAHPELCRVADCDGKVKARGVCDQHLTMLGKAGDTAILMPRADRVEVARKAAATRARETVASTPVVEQPAPAVQLEDGGGVVLKATLTPGFWEWPESTCTAIRPNSDGGFVAYADRGDASPTTHPTPEAAAAHLGAVLPGEDARPVLTGSGTMWSWPSGRLAIGLTLAGEYRMYRDGNDIAIPGTAPTLTAALQTLGARLPDASGAGGASPVTTDPTPRERELQAQVEAQAGQIRRAEQARVVAEVNAASADRTLSGILDALDAAGAPQGELADRIRALAERPSSGMTAQGARTAAALLLYMEAIATPEGVYLVRALRAAVGIEA